MAACSIAGSSIARIADATQRKSNFRTSSSRDRRRALNIPRDRLSTFDPILVAKHQRRLPKFDDRVISISISPDHRIKS
jgi:transposase-like protein